ncbi:TonB-dependent receptor [Sphingomonas bacterium]|uniref:TonB-dependent receptor n=1 Tax=Sphingomonas bacterium TaxID=1895847 RepID=UPI0015750BA4|nr:carboxypeptidase regulatory-like domain-containing protein [Sphingomonas bacterium]
MTNLSSTRKLLRGSTALQAIALLGASIGLAAIAAPASAQDYTSGAISGSVASADNAPVANATVTLRSQAQNQTRTFQTTGSGSFNATGLAPGNYDVTVRADGYRDTTGTISVVAAQENAVRLTLVSTSAPAEVVVTGARVRQDFTKTTTGLNIDVPGTTSQIALPRSATALTLLAPGTVLGVAGFTTSNGERVPSVGGSSVSENAYYINGLNITNPDTYVGGAKVPFDFYKSFDVQTGGYAAEFGRATGAVLNATTKSGTNTPFMAIHANFQPQQLKSHQKNVGAVDGPVSIGALARDDSTQVALEAGGALIKDHVFLYGLLQTNAQITERAFGLAGTYERDVTNDPFYGGKADVYFTPTQHAEFTYFNTSSHTRITNFAFTPNAAFNGGTIGNVTGVEDQKTGGVNYVGRYTGSITDFFQISAAYGLNKDANNLSPTDPASYYVRDQRAATSPTGTTTTRIISTLQPFQGNTIDATRRRFYRVDGDLRLELLGRHHFRFGFDNEDLSESKINALNGTLPIRYTYANSGVQLLYERLGGNVSGRDRAYYLQDSWEPLTGLTLNLGVRDDEFNQKNLSGQKYLDFKSNFAARAGFSFVPGGDSKFRFTGNYGRYFIPPAMNLGFRGRDLYFAEYFNYPGVTNGTQAGGQTQTAANTAASGAFRTDPVTGLPLLALGSAQTNRAGSGYASTCPTSLAAAPGAPVNGAATCLIYGAGVQDPAFAKVAPGTKATYEDEFLASARFQFTNLISVGLTGTYRKLSRVSEDTDFAPIIATALNCGATGQTGTAAQCNFYTNNSAYYIYNPGSSTVKLVDFTNAGTVFTLTGQTFPKPRRTYEAVSIDFKHADNGVFSLQGSVTLSRLKGNSEGTVKSDAGNTAQTDAGSTQDYDYLGLTDYSNGILPNNHTWIIKAFGSVHVTPKFILGTDIQVVSPTFGSCEGFHPTDPNAAGYGSSSFYCATGALNAAGYYTATAPSPRGTGLKSQWQKTIDLSARYTLPFGNDHILVRGDVFNVFNSRAVAQTYNQHELTKIDATATAPAQYQPDPLYGTATAYTQPRYARLGFDITF